MVSRPKIFNLILGVLMTIFQQYKTFMLNKIVANIHQIQIKNSKFGRETIIVKCSKSSFGRATRFSIFLVGMHSMLEKEHILKIAKILANASIYVYRVLPGE